MAILLSHRLDEIARVHGPKTPLILESLETASGRRGSLSNAGGSGSSGAW
jgi:hypothetical protein